MSSCLLLCSECPRANSRLKRILIEAVALCLATPPSRLGAAENLHRVRAVKDRAVGLSSDAPLAKANGVSRDGLAEAAGAGIAGPPDAEVIDGSKLTVYPGLIDAAGQGDPDRAGVLPRPERPR
jgi:hypothetical protein